MYHSLDFSVLEGKTLTKIIVRASEDNASYAPDPGDNEIYFTVTPQLHSEAHNDEFLNA